MVEQNPGAGLAGVEAGLGSNATDQDDPSPNGPASSRLVLSGRAASGAALNDLCASDRDLGRLGVNALALRDPDASLFCERAFRPATIWVRASSQSLPLGREICLCRDPNLRSRVPNQHSPSISAAQVHVLGARVIKIYVCLRQGRHSRPP